VGKKIKIMKDWTGNKNSVYKTLGASNHTDKERQTFYEEEIKEEVQF